MFRQSIADEGGYELGRRETVELQRQIWRIAPPKPSANVYLIRDTRKNILIDSGTYEGFDYLSQELGRIGLRPQDIDLVINTHEHYDHVGGNAHLFQSALIAAHKAAAAKLANLDEFVTHQKEYKQVGKDYAPQLWLAEGSEIITGEYRWQVIHTPGHTSGSICLYDPEKQIIFTGDTVVKGEYLTPMLESGSAGEFISSLERLLSLKIDVMYPGHGEESTAPETDLRWALATARERVQQMNDSQPLGGKRRISVRADSQNS